MNELELALASERKAAEHNARLTQLNLELKREREDSKLLAQLFLALQDDCNNLKAEVKWLGERLNERGCVDFGFSTEDQPLPEDTDIQAAHPLNTKKFHLYEEAQRLVSAKHSKFALVDLVNWLLYRIEEKK